MSGNASSLFVLSVVLAVCVIGLYSLSQLNLSSNPYCEKFNPSSSSYNGSPQLMSYFNDPCFQNNTLLNAIIIIPLAAGIIRGVIALS